MKLDLGLLILRFCIAGMMFFGHGWGKLANYVLMVDKFPDPLGVGPNVSLMLTIFAEAFCSIAVVVGYATRLVLVPLIITMAVAFFMVHALDPWQKKEMAMLYLVPFVTLLLTGPGKLSLDHLLGRVKQMGK